jgi:Glycosyl hydrolase family 76
VSPEERAAYAGQAVQAYQLMLERFRKRDGLYRYDEGPPVRAAAQLWPFARALVATLDIAGIGDALPEHLDVDGLIEEHLQTLERYWDPAGPRPAYCSDITGARRRGDRYYDDNAWVGLALVELERLRPGSGHLDRAEELFQFAVSGWDQAQGGVFWCEQGRGTCVRNHDRNTVSNAPNAEIGLHLADLGRGQEAGAIGPKEMSQWVLDNLDASRDGESPGTGPFWDKIRGDGTIDRAIWSYNQGSMVGVNVLLARTEAQQRDTHLALAEAIARKALNRFAGTYGQGSPAFLAIFFRNLLLLYEVTTDQGLRGDISAAMSEFGQIAWSRAQTGRKGILGLGGGGPKLLDQSAFVQVLALLAWDPDSYGRLA